MEVLRATGLSKKFGAFEAMRNLDFALTEGCRHALIGPNGAGKTTLINLLTGAVRPTAGSLALYGEDVSRLPMRARVKQGLVRTFQINQLFATLTVFENVSLAVAERLQAPRLFWRRSIGRSDINQETMTLLREFRLEQEALRPVREISYGSQRLVEIAIALALRPRILLMDEPAAGVPGSERGLILDAIDRLSPDISVLMIDHDMDLVFRFAREITVLARGAVLMHGATDAVAADQRVRDVYLGSSYAA